MSEEITEHMFSNKMDLKLLGETQPVFKFVLETKTSENDSISQNRKFSDCTIFADTNALLPSLERISASDDSTATNSSIIHNNISPSTIGSLGAEKGTTPRNLRPRHHMDNLSEYNSKNINICNTAQIFIFSLWNLLFAIFIEKQRINSGFFLYEAEMKKKKENKHRMNITKQAKECRSVKQCKGVYELFR
jgi:hypothetical protein